MSARKVWVVSRVVTEGVRQASVKESFERDGYRYCKVSGDWKSQKLGRDCFDDEVDACVRAVALIDAKLKSIEKLKSKLLSQRGPLAMKAGAK